MDSWPAPAPSSDSRTAPVGVLTAVAANLALLAFFAAA